MRITNRAVLAAVGAAATIAAVGVANAGSTALSNKTITFDNGTCTAQFTKSSSGIVNESNRQSGCSNQWSSTQVYLQFRPLNSTPDPACPTAGLVDSFLWANQEDSLKAYLPIGTNFMTCVYLVNNSVASGTVDSHDVNGSTAQLPVFAGGKYRIDVSGTWNNQSHGLVDAEYDNGDHGSDWTDATFTQDGWPGIGEDWGDLAVNDGFVNWGSYSTNHTYSAAQNLGSSVKLAVFDGTISGGVATPSAGWYDDNVGSLSYTITYLGK